MINIDTRNNSIFTSPDQFENFIVSKKQQVVCNPEGCFKKENACLNLIRRIAQALFGRVIDFNTTKHTNWVKGMVHVFRQIEQSKTEIGVYENRDHLQAANAVITALKTSRSESVQSALAELRLCMASYKYRASACSKYEKKEVVNQKLIERYQPLIEAWKKKEAVFNQSEMTVAEIGVLADFTKYPYFAKQLLKTPAQLERFFEYAFIEKNDIDAFVQFYFTTQKLTDCLISDRIATYGGQDLCVENVELDGKVFKDLTLPFQSLRHSILDENLVVEFSHNLTAPIKDVFQTFKDRATKVGDFEYFGNGQGIINWNPNEWGYRNPVLIDPETGELRDGYERIDVTQPEWYKQMPFTEILTETEVQDKFLDKEGNPLDLAEDDWAFALVGKNRHAHFGLTGSHTMLSVAIPLGNGSRGVLYLGKFAWDFPAENETKRILRMLFDHVPAAIQCPDENVYQVRRKAAYLAVKATSAEAETIMQKIADNKLNVEKKQKFFQIFVKNCMDWAANKIKDLIPPDELLELVGVSFAEATTEGPIKNIQSKWRKFPVALGAIFNGAIKVARPNKESKLKANGEKRVYQMKEEDLFWNLEKRLHPQGIISLQDRNKIR